MDLIQRDKNKRSGQPCVRNLRITVSDVIEMIESGMSNEQIIADFSELNQDDIKACLTF